MIAFRRLDTREAKPEAEPVVTTDSRGVTVVVDGFVVIRSVRDKRFEAEPQDVTAFSLLDEQKGKQ